MTCTVCRSKNREQIDLALIEGESVRKLAQRTRLSPNALQRHRKHHLPNALAQSKCARDLAHSDNMLDRLNSLYADAQIIKNTCMKFKHYRTALMSVRELARLVVITAPLQAQVNSNPELELSKSEEWLQMQTALVIALARFPDARQAVVDAIKQLESKWASGASAQTAKS